MSIVMFVLFVLSVFSQGRNYGLESPLYPSIPTECEKAKWNCVAKHPPEENPDTVMVSCRTGSRSSSTTPPTPGKSSKPT